MPFAFQPLARAAVGGRLVVEFVVTAPGALADGGVGLGEYGEGPAAAGAGEAVEGLGGGVGWHGGGPGLGEVLDLAMSRGLGGSVGYLSGGFFGIWAGLVRFCGVGGRCWLAGDGVWVGVGLLCSPSRLIGAPNRPLLQDGALAPTGRRFG